MRAIVLSLLCLSILACSPVQPSGTTGADPIDPPTGGEPPDPNKNEADGFPTGWKQWEQINEITKTSDGEVRELYANSKATGAPYPNGSVLVKAHYKLAGGSRGALFQLSVMRKNAMGWDYEAYGPSGETRDADAEVCAMCHTQRKANDFVFTQR